MIILLDLNYTLVANSEEKRSPFIKQIKNETYRQWLVDLVQPHHVIMMTARPAKYYQDTLDSILEKTGWKPQEAYFNEYGSPPPVAKSCMLREHVFAKHGENPTQFFAIESNPKTRSMYGGFGIRSTKVENDVIWTKLPID